MYIGISKKIHNYRMADKQSFGIYDGRNTDKSVNIKQPLLTGISGLVSRSILDTLHA